MNDVVELKQADFVALRRQAAAARTPAAIFAAGEAIAAAGVADGPAQRIAILGALTTDYVAHAIACAVAREGVMPVVHQAPFGSYVQEILDPSSGVHKFDPDLVVLAPDWRELTDALPPQDGAAAERAVAGKVALFRELWQRLSARTGRRIVQHLLVPPDEGLTGPAERLLPGTRAAQARRLNAQLLEAAPSHVHWVDMEALAAAAGAGFAPARLYLSARMPFDVRFLPAYVEAFGGAWRDASARGKKVLVLDLDNTLWGGVIGDDGVEGIVLGPGSARGEAFLEWQHHVRALAARGVVLAVCSKNDPAIAEGAFTHPASVLKREDFAAFHCSWEDKAQGLRRIAATLNLGLDSMVFVDDNPAECALVAETLPEVSVVHVGTEPARFAEKLASGHWFDRSRISEEDLARGKMYAARAAAAEAAAGATDMGAFLTSLEMKGRLYRPEEADMLRVAQLEMKTNQFNVLTRRFDEAALRGFLADAAAEVLVLRLADRFGDHGLVSTLIAVARGDVMEIESWLMSCRVFSRSAEAFMMNGLIARARARGVSRIRGAYRPTAKNGVVAELYPRLGFAEVEAGAAWELDLAAAEPLATAISLG
jgi:FkbH-like protein